MRHIMSPVFAIGVIHIGQVEGASCVNIGNNWPSNFRSYKKHNQGFGSVTGDRNSIQGLRSLLNDPDTYDMMSVPSDEVPEWISDFLEATSNPNVKEEKSSVQKGEKTEAGVKGEPTH